MTEPSAFLCCSMPCMSGIMHMEQTSDEDCQARQHFASQISASAKQNCGLRLVLDLKQLASLLHCVRGMPLRPAPEELYKGCMATLLHTLRVF